MVSVHSNPRERQYQRMFNYHTIALISDASKVMFKIFQVRLQQYMNHALPDVQGGFRKQRKTENKGEKEKIHPFECRVPKNSKER